MVKSLCISKVDVIAVPCLVERGQLFQLIRDGVDISGDGLFSLFERQGHGIDAPGKFPHLIQRV